MAVRPALGRRVTRSSASIPQVLPADRGVEIVVLTCRLDDYLEPAEVPPPHVVDLGVIVEDGV